MPQHDYIDDNETPHLTRRDFLRIGATTAVVTGVGLQHLGDIIAAPAAVATNEFLPSPLETRILGANTVLSGSRTALRIVTLDHRSGAPVAAAGVRVSLVTRGANGQPNEQTLYKGYTNRRGTVDAAFTMPALPQGGYELRVNTTSTLGTDSFTTPLTVTAATQILLTTDKPLYQPSQTIHLRALALNRPDLKPAAKQAVLFEVEDAKGNKVFKKELNSGEFGVAATEFVLADEVNFGRYTVRAIMGDSITEKKVTVDRYVLPKFKTLLTTDKSYYLPGETIHGTVQVDYFFGKPVAGGKVTVQAATFDVGFNQFAELKGTTDASGTWKFETKVPSSLVGLPLEQGKALVKLDAAVQDKAEHTEQVTHTVPVAKDAITIAVVPESGALVPGVLNTVYVLTSYPDGAPATTHFTFKSNGIDLAGSTDKLGIGEVKLTPMEGFRTAQGRKAAGGEDAGQVVINDAVPDFAPRRAFGAGAANQPAPPLAVAVAAADAQGNRGATNASLERRGGDESLLLRTDRAVARVGDTLRLDVIATQPGGTVYVDLIKDKQTVLTRSVYLHRGRGEMRLDLDETFAGTLQAHAYFITPAGEIVRDTKIVYVNAASDLKIKVEADKNTYRPGAPAKIDFQVSDARGYPVLAALGVNIVDESVFALQEMQPGMEKIYFTLEKELLEPKVEIHGHDVEEVLPTADEKPRFNADKQKVARVLFAAAQPMVEFGIDWNSFDAKLQQVLPKWQERMAKDAAVVNAALAKYRDSNKKLPAPANAMKALLDADLLDKAAARDPLGTPYRLEAPFNHDLGNGFLLVSAGPDCKFDTDDDLCMGGYIGQSLSDLRLRKHAAMDDFTVADGDFAGAGGPRVAFRAVAPMAMAATVRTEPMGKPMSAQGGGGAASDAMAPAEEPVRVRQFFPETLYVNPQVITDTRGRASVNLDMADSITTWRLTTLASSAAGALGSTTAPLRVFQDFFVDLDLPVSLTQNDEVALPVAVYNYLPDAQTVHLKLDMPADAWFEMVSDEPEKSLDIAGNQVGVVYFHLAARAIGNHKLTVTARGTKLSDAIERGIEVRPDGREVAAAINDRLEGSVRKTVHIPDEALGSASGLLVRVYPGAFSQVVDGLDKLLQMPYGCFEQNASVAYPNILVMDYLRKTKQIKPELEMRVEAYINTGYQRALTYEVPGGGFSWFGQPPAHKVLTSYGLLMFKDMAKVHHVDPAVIARTQQWLAGQQKQDGSWEVDSGGIQEGIINRQTDALRVAAYILWGLAESGYQGPQIAKAAAYVGARFESEKDAYAMAVVANALVCADKNSAAAARAIERLVAMKVEDARTVYWNSAAPTYTGAGGDAADIETTALAAYALLRAGRATTVANKALTYLIGHKDPQGTWGSTQGTVWSLRALLAAMDKAAGDANGEVVVLINGQQAGAFAITPKDADVMRQIDLKPHVKTGDNEVELKFGGQGSALYAISSKYYLPWKGVRPISDEAPDRPLDVMVKYNRTELSVNDMVTCQVRVTNRQPQGVKNVIIDLGIPPGFEVQTGDLAELVGSHKIARFSPTGRQVIVYLDGLQAGQTLSFDYRLKAKFPLKAKTPASTVYEYYTPDHRAQSAPVGLVVAKA